MNTKLRIGMIGGGPGAFIGAVHRIALRLDDQYELVCGCFSSDPIKSRQTGEELNLDDERIYGSYQELFEKESQLPPDVRIQVVSIVTPNHAHFEPAKLALENNIHVIIDKPLVLSYSEAVALKRVADASKARLCVTYTYTGYPMVKEARSLVAAEKIGAVRKVYVEYPQGWLSDFAEADLTNKQAVWRTDPQRSGIAGAMGDIGTHAFNLAEYVSGLQITHISADINTVVNGRQLDDDGAALLKFSNGASGVLFATQIAAGEENNVKIRIYGEKGGIEWQQNEANTLILKLPGQSIQYYRTGGDYLSTGARHNTRTPAGHPEGYLEAFANLYRNFAMTIKAVIAGIEPKPEWLDYPGINDGVRGMWFIDQVITSGSSREKWIEL